ncbi:MAG: Mur ligase family protein [bacterium]|nr:Mur ligase family protein [bacterium]
MKSFFKSIIIRLLTWEAKLVLRKYKPHIVAITGTVGKTTTKDAVYEALTPFVSVRKNEKSFNSTFGVPLTILGLESAYGNPLLWIRNVIQGLFVLLPFNFQLQTKNYPEWLVLEVGVGEPGDIQQFEKWLPLDVAVFTRFARMPVHVEYFTSPEAVFEEKKILLRMLKKDGVLVLNADDAAVRDLKNLKPSPPSAPFQRGSAESARRRGSEGGDRGGVITFGTSPLGKGAALGGCDVCGNGYAVVYDSASTFPKGGSFTIETQGKRFPITVRGVVGEHLMHPILAAVAVAVALGFDVPRAVENLQQFMPPAGRMRLLQGRGGTLLIDDSYNASPIAVSEGLRTLAGLKSSGRKIAVLGDMAELGAHSADEHVKAGALVAKSAGELIAVGEFALQYVLGAQEAGMGKEHIMLCQNSREAGETLAEMLAKGDVALIKGSARMHMERTVEKVMAQPERAKELLVRQEKSWRFR